MNTQPLTIIQCHSLHFCIAESVFTLPRAAHLPWEQMKHLSHFTVTTRERESSSDSFLHPRNMEIRRFLFGLCVFFCFYRSVLASTCKLKAKFNLSGYKNIDKKKVVVGGMFPVHMRIASSDGNTSNVPVSAGCVGWVEPSMTCSYVFFSHCNCVGLVSFSWGC